MLFEAPETRVNPTHYNKRVESVEVLGFTSDI